MSEAEPTSATTGAPTSADAGLPWHQPLPSPRARVVIADPDWAYQAWTRANRGSPDDHYETSPIDEIKALPVASWCDDQAVLALWGTFPKLPQAVEVMQAWGFEHVTAFPWIKTTKDLSKIRTVMGFWVRGAAEFVAIGRRSAVSGARGAMKLKKGFVGTVRAGGIEAGLKSMTPVGLLTDDSEDPPGTHFYAPITGHSRKPLALHEWLEQRYDGPYLELFARTERPGWTCWGDELGVKLTPDGAFSCQTVEPKKKARGS